MSKQIFEAVQLSIDKLEAYGFECDGGTLVNCEDWMIVKAGFYKVCIDNDELVKVRDAEPAKEFTIPVHLGVEVDTVMRESTDTLGVYAENIPTPAIFRRADPAPGTYAAFVETRFKTGEKTLAELGALSMERFHAAVGMVGEVFELMTAGSGSNAVEELGDIAFYLTAFCNTLGITDADLSGMVLLDDCPRDIPTLAKCVHVVFDKTKKEALYCKPFSVQVGELAAIAHLLDKLAMAYGMTLESLWEANKEKLETRYPTGYSNAAAQARADKKDGE